MDEDWDDEDVEWGEAPPFTIPEPSGDRLTRLAESRQAALTLWEQVQREIRRTTL